MSILDLKRGPWHPLRPVELHPDDVVRHDRLGEKGHDEVWGNHEYTVFLRYLSPQGKAGAVHLSIKRVDGGPTHDWRELQAIKNDIVGPEREGIELYPA